MFKCTASACGRCSVPYLKFSVWKGCGSRPYNARRSSSTAGASAICLALRTRPGIGDTPHVGRRSAAALRPPAAGSQLDLRDRPVDRLVRNLWVENQDAVSVERFLRRVPITGLPQHRPYGIRTGKLPVGRVRLASLLRGWELHIEHDLDGVLNLERAHQRAVWLDAPLALRH